MALCVAASSLAVNVRENRVLRFSSSVSGPNRSGFGRFSCFNPGNRRSLACPVQAACFFNPVDQPILKEALKEPVAFMGGMFAGLLRLDLEEEPLKEWVTRTVEASGVSIEDSDGDEVSNPEEAPQQIEIE